MALCHLVRIDQRIVNVSKFEKLQLPVRHYKMLVIFEVLWDVEKLIKGDYGQVLVDGV